MDEYRNIKFTCQTWSSFTSDSSHSLVSVSTFSSDSCFADSKSDIPIPNYFQLLKFCMGISHWINISDFHKVNNRHDKVPSQYQCMHWPWEGYFQFRRVNLGDVWFFFYINLLCLELIEYCIYSSNIFYLQLKWCNNFNQLEIKQVNLICNII